MHKLVKILTSRLIIMAVLIILQVATFLTWVLNSSVAYTVNTVASIIGVVIVIYVINKPEEPMYKIAWSIFVLTLPVIGGFLYLLCAGRKMPKKLFNGTTNANHRMENLLVQDKKTLDELKACENSNIYKMFYHGLNVSKFPIYQKTTSNFFSSGEEFFPVLLEDLKKAKHFIFIETFIIDEGKMWDEILQILKEKVKEGVEVKLIYDDFGCSTTLPMSYHKKLNEMGIETYVFNRLRPVLAVQMNNRDHRKIIVIDNRVGFTGGVNLADEYINQYKRFGYWRDSVIRLEGKAVWSLTVMFLGMYSYLKEDDEDISYQTYDLPCEQIEGDGFYQPFSDTPTDDADIGLNTHLNIVNQAQKYVYINTPYLVLNNDMQTALCLAARNGVDVRILVPHIADKRYVFWITQSNYEVLLRSGVKIYEFTPGFNHSKTVFSDDEIGLVGTVNTDYRSYYLHFEDGVLMYQTPEIQEMKEDFLNALQQSQQITLEDCRKVNALTRLFRAVLKIFAPLF